MTSVALPAALSLENHQANCFFCGRHNPAVQVVCERKCLICSICLKSKVIRKLLTQSLVDPVRVARGGCECPLCETPMAPNMAITVKGFLSCISDLDADGLAEVALNLKEKANPFALYYQKALDLAGFDLSSEHLSVEARVVQQRCYSLLSAIEDAVANRLSSVGAMEFIVDIYCLMWERHLRGVPMESEPFHDIVTSSASSQKKKWGSSADAASGGGAAEPTGNNGASVSAADAEMVAMASQGRATRLGKFKCLIDVLQSQLSFQLLCNAQRQNLPRAGSNKPSNSTSFMKPLSTTKLMSKGQAGGTASMSKLTVLAMRPSNSQQSSIAVSKSQDHHSRPSSGGNQVPGSAIGDTPGSSSSPDAPPLGIYHLALLGRLVGLFPAPIAIDRPAVQCISILMLVHLTSPKLNLKRTYDGRSSLFQSGSEPTVREVSPALAEAVYGASTSSVPSARLDSRPGYSVVSLKKLLRLLNCMCGGIIDPHWAMATLKVPCVENGAPAPWSASSISKLLAVLLLRSTPSAGQARQQDTSSYRRASAANLQEAPTRSDVLLSLFEISNHIRELWGEKICRTTTKHQGTVFPGGGSSTGTKASSLIRRVSSVAQSAAAGLLDCDSIVLSKCKNLKEYLESAIFQFNSNSSELWPDRSGAQVDLSSFSLPREEISQLSRLSGINFKSALRLAGSRTIDMGLAVYICVEAWCAEIRLVEKNIKVAISSALRKTAMSLMTLDPSDLRPLTLPEKYCLRDLIQHYLFGDEQVEGGAVTAFGERSLSRIASFSSQSREERDIFSAVDMIAKSVDWYMLRKLHHQRLAAEGGNSELSAFCRSNTTTAATSNVELYVPPDSAALRSLLLLRDVELSFHTVNVAKTLVKSSLWASHMSDRSGWMDNYSWHPIQLSGKVKQEVQRLTSNGISLNKFFESFSRRNKEEIELKRSMSNALAKEQDLNDRSDMEAANMIDTSSESEEEEHVEDTTAKGDESTIRAMTVVHGKQNRSALKGTTKRRALFAKQHPLSYMSHSFDSNYGKHPSEVGTDDNSVTSEPIKWESKINQPAAEPGFEYRRRILTADKLRRRLEPAITVERTSNFVEKENIRSVSLEHPRYLNSEGLWAWWPIDELVDVDGLIQGLVKSNSLLDSQISIETDGADGVGNARLGDKPFDGVGLQSSVWMPNDSMDDLENAHILNIELHDTDFVSIPVAGGMRDIGSLEQGATGFVSLLEYLRSRDQVRHKVCESNKDEYSGASVLIRSRSPMNPADSLSTQLAVGSTAFAQSDPYYYFNDGYGESVRGGNNAKRGLIASLAQKNADSKLPGGGSQRPPLKRQVSNMSSQPTIISSNFGDDQQSVGVINSSSHTSAAAMPSKVRLEKSSIAPALTRLAERTGSAEYFKRPLRTDEAEPAPVVVASQLYGNLTDAWTGRVVAESGAQRGSSLLVYGMTDIISNSSIIMANCGALPPHSNVHHSISVTGDERHFQPPVASEPTLQESGTKLLVSSASLSRHRPRTASEFQYQSRTPSPSYLYDRGTLDLGPSPVRYLPSHSSVCSSLIRYRQPTTHIPGHRRFHLLSTVLLCLLLFAICDSLRYNPLCLYIKGEESERPVKQLLLRESRLSTKEFNELLTRNFGHNSVGCSTAAIQTSGPISKQQGALLFSSLMRLDLYGSNMNKQMVHLLANYASTSCNIKDIDLGKNKLNDGLLNHLLSAIRMGGGNRYLEKLSVKDNVNLTINSPPIMSILKEFQVLKYLDFGGNRFDVTIEKREGQFSVLLKHLCALSVLSLACIALRDPGAAIVLKAASGHKALRVFDISHSLITFTESEKYLIEYLESFQTDGAGDVGADRLLLLHGMIWGTSSPDITGQSKVEEQRDARKTTVQKVALKHGFTVVFDGHYDGIEVTQCVH